MFDDNADDDNDDNNNNSDDNDDNNNDDDDDDDDHRSSFVVVSSKLTVVDIALPGCTVSESVTTLGIELLSQLINKQINNICD